MEEGIAAAGSTLSDLAANSFETASAAAAAGLAPNMAFDNASMWHNFTTWTVQHLAFLNMTRLAPSLDDLVWAGPRMVMKLGKLGSFISFPDEFAQRVIPEATDSGIIFRSATAALTSAAGSDAAATAAGAATNVDTESAASASRFSLEGARGLGSVFSYATSRWALCCIAMAVVLNRTHIFAATRRRMRLRWPVRLLLRFLPIVLFLMQARRLLQSMQCQTSPDFAEMRWGNASKSSDLMFSQENPFLHGLSSNLLLGAADIDSCRAVRMVPAHRLDLASELKGSLSLLWPLFGTFCLSQFLESVSCALQGRAVSAETWMTLFEHSLAFAEADAAISNQLGWGMFTSSSAAAVAAAANATSVGNLGPNIAISRQMIMKRVNTPPEVLLVAFISAMSHVTSHTLGIFNKQAKFRLLNTGFWAVFFIGSIFYSTVTFSVDDPAKQGLLRFPTVCLIGFVPHLLVLLGILVCIAIYALAIGLSALAQADDPDAAPLSIRQRLARAHDNMQANVPLADIRINMEMDFYSALLRAGFGAITMASEAVYLNEDRRVSLKSHTWLEDDRFREIEEMRAMMGAGIPGSRFDGVGTVGLVPRTEGGDLLATTSGYARERVAQKPAKGGKDRAPRPARDGVGAAERSSRWLMALEYGLHVNRLIITFYAIYACRALAFVGVRNPPRWLLWLARRPKATRADENQGAGDADGVGQPVNEWLNHGTSGSIRIPRTDGIDVEKELRRRLITHDEKYSRNDEGEIDTRLYKWWLMGGWWGNSDSSGDYAPTTNPIEPDDDLTSVISASDAASIASDVDVAWESDSDLDDGQRTPTQRDPLPFTRESTPLSDSPMALSELARLLNPRSPSDREQARALSAHLDSNTIMTRAGYRRFSQLQRAEVLASNPTFSTPTARRRAGATAKMTPEEEAQVLEELLLSRRGGASGGGTWATGAAGMGPEGPQCVVCQSAARTIIVWPCRCLSLCDDCRVSLAMNNFDKCVCCRREVISFSRIFVP